MATLLAATSVNRVVREETDASIRLALYLGSNRELKERKDRFITIETLSDAQKPVREYVREPYAYYVGSHSGWSCGFPHLVAESDIEFFEAMFNDATEGRSDDIDSVHELLSVIDDALVDEISCTLYPVWNGSESEPPKDDVNWQRSKLSPESFVVTEQFRYKIHAEQIHAPKNPTVRF